MSVTQRVATFAAGLAGADVPAEVRSVARSAILDGLDARHPVDLYGWR